MSTHRVEFMSMKEASGLWWELAMISLASLNWLTPIQQRHESRTCLWHTTKHCFNSHCAQCNARVICFECNTVARAGGLWVEFARSTLWKYKSNETYLVELVCGYVRGHVQHVCRRLYPYSQNDISQNGQFTSSNKFQEEYFFVHYIQIKCNIYSQVSTFVILLFFLSKSDI